MQFFGQVMIDAVADQVERSAVAQGTIVVPIPTDTSAGDTDGSTATAAEESEGSDASLDAGGNADITATDGADGTATSTEVSVEVSLPVTWSEDGQVVCHVVYELNDEEILAFQPVETWHSGRHLLSLYYPIEQIVANYTNTFNVYLWMTGGMGTIETGGIIASISGQAMAAEEAWDGKLYVEETIGLLRIGGGIGVRSYSETMKKETMELVQRSYSDYLEAKITIGSFGKPIEL